MVKVNSELYTIGEMAQFFGLSRQTLIYYDKIGLFKPAAVNAAGHRFYVPMQIPVLRLVCLLKDLGLELKEIDSIIDSRETDQLVSYLHARRDEIEEHIEELTVQHELIDQRINFYQGVDEWRATVGHPVIRQFPERRVVFEPFPFSDSIDRAVLHPNLMRSMQKLRSEGHIAPVAGFGTMLRRESLNTENVYEGAGTFVVVPQGVDHSKFTDVVVLPAGLYACCSYWGMPYDGTGVTQILSWMDEHHFDPITNAFDFCLLDAVSYNDIRHEDFCCIQVGIAP